MRTVYAIALSIGLSSTVFAGSALALPDLVIDYSNVQLHASSPTADTGTVVAPIPVGNQGYTQANPWSIPCDTTEFSAGLSFSYANIGPSVYPELMGKFYLNGNEHTPIVSHGYANTVPAGFDHSTAADDNILMSPGDVLAEGFIFITQSVPFWQWGFQGSDLPANAPVKMHMTVRSYSCDTWDNNAGGYSPACILGDAVPWNNALNIWMVRTCP